MTMPEASSSRHERVGSLFDLDGRVAIVTGGAGLLGRQHGAVLAAAGAHVVLLDLPGADPARHAAFLGATSGRDCLGLATDITNERSVADACAAVLGRFGRVDILVNNAANNPKVEDTSPERPWSRLENFSLDAWNADLAVGLTGAFLCARVFGMAVVANKRGVIVNVASDLSVIAPDQRLYRKSGLADHEQPVKPVTYSVVKTALIGLTRYLATYWAAQNIRVNALSPGGVFADQADEFLARLCPLIPMGRMAHADEYQGAMLFLCSDASSYMTGQNLVVDGGRTTL